MAKINFVPRTSKPEAGNKYYIRKADGGYNSAIKGKPVDECNVLANCVGYTYGRFNEVGQYGSCKYLAPVNPPAFPDYADGCETGSEPRLGAVIVWINSDNGGHVGNVEAIIDNDTIVTSESHYGGSAFDLNIRKRVNGEFQFKEGYTFKCFIYHPDVEEREDYNTLNNKYIQLLAEYENLKGGYALIRDRNATLKAKLLDTESLLATTQDQLESKVKEVQNSLTTLISSYGELNTQYLAITNDYNKARKECDKLNKEYEILEKDYTTLKVDYESFVNTVNDLKGDVNCDGKIDFSDVIKLFKYCVNPKKYPLN